MFGHVWGITFLTYVFSLFTIARDCGSLSDPENGRVTFRGTTPGSVSQYFCNAGFILMGLPTRVCGVNGSWSGEAPVCEGMSHCVKRMIYNTTHLCMYFSLSIALDCGPLSNPDNGLVIFRRTTLGSVANYSCNAGYVLMGIPFRICGVDGSWSGETPVCERECCMCE